MFLSAWRAVDVPPAATVAPARAFGSPDLGVLRPGCPADVVMLDDELSVLRTFVAGEQVWPDEVVDLLPLRNDRPETA